MTATSPQLDREAIQRLYELVLGRTPEAEHVYDTFRDCTVEFALTVFFDGPEFADVVRREVGRLTPPRGGFYDAPPSEGVRAWVVETLSLTPEGREAVLAAASWAQIYDRLFDDPLFIESTGLGERPWTPHQRRALKAMASTPDGSARKAEIEEIHRGRVRGWVVDAADPGTPVAVEFWLDDAFVAATTANAFRRDVQDAYGGSGIAGFSCDLSIRGQRTSGGRLEIRDAESRRILVAADLPDYTPPLEPHESVRSELVQVRSVLERLEAALPALASRQGFSLSDYPDYHEAFYRPTRPDDLAIAPGETAVAAIVADVTGASAGQVEDLVWSAVRQIAPVTGLHLHGAADYDEALLRDLQTRIDWSGTLAVPAADWLSLHATRISALDKASGEVTILAGAPGVLAPDAVHRLAEALTQDDAGAAYADDDRLEGDEPADLAAHVHPRFKTDFDIDWLSQTPFVGDCVAFRTDALRPLIGLDHFASALGPAQAVLRLARQGQKIAHVPRVLWSGCDAEALDAPTWPEIVAGILSQVEGIVVEPYSDDLGCAPTGAARIRRAVPEGITATVIIPTRDRLDLLAPCIDSLEAARPMNRTAMDLMIVDHESSDPETVSWLEAIRERPDVRVGGHQGPFNWALINNLAAATSTADVLVFLNNDTMVLSRDWLDELVAQAMRPEVGVVGARLLYEDGTLQHGGFVARDRVEHYLSHDGVGLPGSDAGYLDRYAFLRRSVAVTGACMAVRREVFETLGGFDAARLAVEGNDVDLCLRAQAAGLAVLYNPHATLYHLESKSRGFSRDGAARQASIAAGRIVWDRWMERGFGVGDYNPHFDREARPFARLRSPTIGWPEPVVAPPEPIPAEPDPSWAARLLSMIRKSVSAPGA
ncbi:glycosyltransferase [Brevundimonas staleyi]|uniref:Glycosyltransferase n=1 Tax=Brevundimonas staleyi TaxID=74326 RepID=A0ABW0FQH7_9CAUL